MACEECARLQGQGRRNVQLRREITECRRSADEVFLALCNDRATEAMATLWASGHFDCGPDNYETIIEQCLTALARCAALDKKSAILDSMKSAAHLCQEDTPWFHSDRDFGDESGHITD